MLSVIAVWVFFVFQAEDGIRDLTVTGVQTCALPISRFAVDGAQDAPRLLQPRHRTERHRARTIAIQVCRQGEGQRNQPTSSQPLDEAAADEPGQPAKSR